MAVTSIADRKHCFAGNLKRRSIVDGIDRDGDGVIGFGLIGCQSRNFVGGQGPFVNTSVVDLAFEVEVCIAAINVGTDPRVAETRGGIVNRR